MKIINATNGNFSLNSEMIIKINQHFDEVYGFNINKTTENMRNDYEWIYFKNIKIENLYFSLGVCFFKSKTKLINFSFSETDLNYLNWDNWSEKEEKQKLEKFEKWLNEIIGKQREFNWGKISANTDNKGAGTSILVSYN
jgi:hypothetical protein